ncbi:MAG: HAD family hydrolase [Parcubacteria group bacterium]|jgi:putative hydrolase of the HAD superfamily
MKNIIIFDADGVVVKREIYFNSRLERDYGIPAEETAPFFKNEYKLCAVGKADLEEELEKHIDAWGWKGTMDELIKYWFESERELDEEIVQEIKSLQELGYMCCLATNNEAYRTKYLVQEVGLGKVFDKTFSSSQLGYLKSQKRFWEELSERLEGVKRNEVLVWDNDEENIKAAKEFGFTARRYRGYDDFRTEMQKLFPQISFIQPLKK